MITQSFQKMEKAMFNNLSLLRNSSISNKKINIIIKGITSSFQLFFFISVEIIFNCLRFRKY